MDGTAFENVVAARMRSFGWDSTVTPGSSDYGADVLCTLGSTKLVIQCKCYADTSYVGGEAVKEAYAAMAHYRASHGLVVFRGRPTKQALRWAKTTGVDLFHFDELKVGWKFDRTQEGVEVRRRRALEEAQEQKYREHMEEQRYRSALVDFEDQLRRWSAASRSHEDYKELAGVALLIGMVALIGESYWVTFAALLGAACAYWGTSPGSRPSAPTKPLHMDHPTKPLHMDYPATAHVPRSFPVEAARWLRLVGYTIDQRNGSWLLRDKRGTVRQLSNDELVEFAAGKARVSCAGCGVKLRAPAQEEVGLKCPKCGTSRTYLT